MLIVGKAMIRNKPDSYCKSWDLGTHGISTLVDDLLGLYLHYGVNPEARLAYQSARLLGRREGALSRAWRRLAGYGRSRR